MNRNFILVGIVIIVLFSLLYGLFSFSGYVSNNLQTHYQDNETFYSLELFIPSTYKLVSSGDEFFFSLKVLKLGNFERRDANLEIIIRSLTGEIIERSTETFAIENQVNLVRLNHISENTIPGFYEVETVVSDDTGARSTTSGTFEVIRKKASKDITIQFITISWIITSIILFIALYVIIRFRK